MSFQDLLVSGWTTFLGHVEHPKWLIAIPFLLVIMFLILRRDFVKLAEDKFTKAMRRRQQFVILILRSLAIIVLVLALSSPFAERQKTIEGDPSLKILVDHSGSMSVFPDDIGDNLKARLEQVINVEQHSIASGMSSSLGDGILNNIRDGENVVLVTDGQANLGASLGDVGLFASTHGITFNAIKLNPTSDDAWVQIDGPDKTVANVDNTFTVTVGWASKTQKAVSATVLVDGRAALDISEPGTFTLTEKFGEGFHRIEARITS
ncbi:hypothetical protein HY492_01605, partial [Candidatus Woesearchaeota archaeon]|nr:hypothetical protein [Candidatus Woesearchaeota archaeon]